MRFWLYDEDILSGPYTPEQLKDRPSFGGKTLVHPEERLNPGEERWRPAADVPQLALLLDEKERAAFSKSFTPPAPTVRDLPVLGSILEQVERLEGVAVGMRSQLKTHDGELGDITAASRAAARRDAELQRLIDGLEARLAALEPLPVEVAALRKALADSEAARTSLADRLQGVIAGYEAERQRALEVQKDVPANFEAVRAEAASLKSALDAAREEGAALAKRLEDAHGELGRLTGELAALGEREQGRWRLGQRALTPQGLFAGVVASALLALAALVLPFVPRLSSLKLPFPRKTATATPAPVKAPPPETASAPAPAPRMAVKPRAKPKPKAAPLPTKAEVTKRIKQTILMRTTGGVVSAAENGKALAFVKGFLAPSPGLESCPLSAADVAAREGGRVRTPQEALECWAWRRYEANAAALADAKKLDRAAALAQLGRDAAEWGGPERLFPPDSSVRRSAGQTFVVELKRADALGQKLRERYGTGPAVVPDLDLRYEVDLAAQTVRPLDPASWKVLDADAAAKAAPGEAGPAYKRPAVEPASAPADTSAPSAPAAAPADTPPSAESLLPGLQPSAKDAPPAAETSSSSAPSTRSDAAPLKFHRGMR